MQRKIFLERQLQLDRQFIEDYIQTVFLDGKPVDDLDRAFVKDGCTLALFLGSARTGGCDNAPGRLLCAAAQPDFP